MKFFNETSQIFIPDQLPIDKALERTTHLCIAAHQDDIEIMAALPILECYQQPDKWFTAVIMSDGHGSPRSGIYARFSDEEMRQVRLKEQRKAAVIGEYGALIMLDYPSSILKDGKKQTPIDDLQEVLQLVQPCPVYTHNLADKHDTHVAVALRTIAACRRLPIEKRPTDLFGCEVWRGLDWVMDDEKILLNLSKQENLQSALLSVFDSQISGGKRYDLATLARRRANASYLESHAIDSATALSIAIDLTPLLQDDLLSPATLAQGYIQRFQNDVISRLERVG